MKMKKVCILVITLFLVFGLSSCNLSSENTTDRLDQLRQEYEGIGVAHNEALSLVYQDLAAESAVRQLSFDDCMDIANRCLDSKKIPSLNAIIGSGSGSSDAYRACMAMLPSLSGLLAKPAANAAIIDDLSEEIEIIGRYKDIYDKMVNILDAGSATESKIQELEQLYLVIDTDVESAEDKEALMNSLRTLMHSASYWDEQWNEWGATFSGGMQKTAAVGIIGGLAIIDGVGAVVGTVEGFQNTKPGEEGRGWTILGSAAKEACKFSITAALSLILL